MGHAARNGTAAPSRAAALLPLIPVAAVVLALLGLRLLTQLRGPGAMDSPDTAVAATVCAAVLAVAGWWLGGLLMAALALVARRLRWTGVERWALRLTPRLAARTAAALVGAQLAVVAPAQAADSPVDPFWGPTATGTEQLAAPQHDTTPPQDTAASPGPRDAGGHTERQPDLLGDPSAAGPAAPSTPPAPSHGPLRQSGAPARIVDGTVTVVRGDTLWDITQQLLGPGAPDEEICEHLGSWAEHNTLAQNGDLIHPGDQLQVPQQLLDAARSTP